MSSVFRLIPILTAFVSLVLVSLFRVWVHQSIIQDGYAISQARSEGSELDKELKALMVEYSALRSPERLQKVARESGLSPMAPHQLHIVHVEVRP